MGYFENLAIGIRNFTGKNGLSICIINVIRCQYHKAIRTTNAVVSLPLPTTICKRLRPLFFILSEKIKFRNANTMKLRKIAQLYLKSPLAQSKKKKVAT